MKLYLSADMEGTAAVASWTQVDPKNTTEYPYYRRLMSREVRAAIDGAREAGVGEVLVNDSHSAMRNVLWDELPADVRMIYGNRKPFSMNEGADASFDVAFFTGYHAGIGEANGVLDHTYTDATLYDTRVNGVRCNEAILNAAVLGRGSPAWWSKNRSAAMRLIRFHPSAPASSSAPEPSRRSKAARGPGPFRSSRRSFWKSISRSRTTPISPSSSPASSASAAAACVSFTTTSARSSKPTSRHFAWPAAPTLPYDPVTTIGFQGEPGAFSDEAAHLLVDNARTRGYRTFDELIAAVDRREVDYGLLPVENSIYGAIARSYDLLWEFPALRIVDEIVFAVVQNLIGLPTATIDDITEVRSHPVALEQVRRLFDEHPLWRRVVVDDTAAAVAQVVAGSDKTVAAIASAFAAERYGARILRAGVQDDDDNFTRFYLLQPHGSARRSLRRACVALELADAPGSLRDALSAFADRDINLRSLVSRPSRARAFRYRFYCEIDRVDEDRVRAALADIQGDSRIFGVY